MLDRLKLFVCSGVIIVAYLFLSLIGVANWILILIVVSIVVLVLLVYTFYQIGGIYYYDVAELKEKTKNMLPV